MKLTYNGLSLGEGTEYTIENIQGLDISEVDVISQRSHGNDGDIFLDFIRQPKNLILSGSFTAIGEENINIKKDEMRKAFGQFSNSYIAESKKQKKITITTNQGVTRYIDGICSMLEFPYSINRNGIQKYLIKFRCQSPYFYGGEIVSTGEKVEFETTDDFYIGGVVYSPELKLIISNGLTIADLKYSYDGIYFFNCDIGDINSLSTVIHKYWSNEYQCFLLIYNDSGDYKLAKSTDGFTFAYVNQFDIDANKLLTGVINGENCIISYNNNSDDQYRYIIDNDLSISFSSGNMPFDVNVSMCFYGATNRFYTGTSDTNARIYYTDDLINWNYYEPFSGNVNICGIYYEETNSILLVISNGEVFYSIDGVNFIESSFDTLSGSFSYTQNMFLFDKNSNILYIGNSTKFYKSIDYGSNFDIISSTFSLGVTVNPIYINHLNKSIIIFNQSELEDTTAEYTIDFTDTLDNEYTNYYAININNIGNENCPIELSIPIPSGGSLGDNLYISLNAPYSGDDTQKYLMIISLEDLPAGVVKIITEIGKKDILQFGESIIDKLIGGNSEFFGIYGDRSNVIYTYISGLVQNTAPTITYKPYYLGVN